MGAIDDFINNKESEADKYMQIISGMSNHPDYEYAGDTLDGIYDNIADNGRITDAQKKAIENIQAKPSEHRYGRRY